MVQIVTFEREKHLAEWQEFILASYANPDYVLLSPAFLRWQFFDNPANETGSYTLWLVLHGGSIVAQLGIIPFIGVSPDRAGFRGAYPVNLMVRPEYRAAGLGAILLQKLLEEAECVLNPGVNQAGAVLGLGLGMRDLGHLRRYIRVVDAATAGTLALDGALPAGLAAAAREESRPAEMMATTALPQETPESFAAPAPVFAALRDRKFLRWRYEQHPAFRYEFLLSASLQSILVFHEERERSTGALVIRVVDFLARHEDEEALLNGAIATARERRAAIVDFFCSLDHYDSSLRRAGFFEETEHPETRIAALFQPLDFRRTSIRVIASPPPGDAVGEAGWYISKADSDQDRPNNKSAVAEDPM